MVDSALVDWSPSKAPKFGIVSCRRPNLERIDLKVATNGAADVLEDGSGFGVLRDSANDRSVISISYLMV